MAKIIEINESENVLSFATEEESIVANCSNYFMKFNLSEDWLSSSVVTAVFSMAGVKHFVELDAEHQCKIPPASTGRVVFWLRAAISETETITSTVLTIQVTPSGNPDFNEEPVYVNAHRELLGVVESLKQGDIVAKKALTAEKSESQVSLTGEQNVSGLKNFVDGVQSHGEDVATQPQIFNENLLLNPDFRVNQRGKESYTTSGYTVDRWQIPTGVSQTKVQPIANRGVYISSDAANENILQYRFEESDIASFAGKTFTLSMKCSEIEFGSVELRVIDETNNIEISNHENALTSAGLFKMTFTLPNELSNVFRIVMHCNEAISIYVDYIKFEYGTQATQHRPRPYVRELFDCQRYFVPYRKGLYVFPGYTASGRNATNVTVTLPNTIRIMPTMTTIDKGYIRYNGTEYVPSYFLVTTHYENRITVSFNRTVEAFHTATWSQFEIELDAEIY